MKGKNANRLRRARRGRAKMSELGMHRLVVHRTPMHIYAQVISPTGSEVVTAASTLEADIKKDLGHTGNVDAARVIGGKIAERAKAAGVATVAFDRSGYKYHGRIKALADAAREGGLEF